MTNPQRSTVVGVFRDRQQAERAIAELRQMGFNDDQIGFVMQGQDGGTTTTTSGQAQGENAGAGAATGAVTGGVIGGLIAAAASLLIPGFGPVIAGGILATVLGGAAVGAAAGGLLGALTGLGVPEEEARYYESEVQSGRTLVTVKAGNRYQDVINVLRRNGAYDASSQAAHTAGTTGQTTATTGQATAHTQQTTAQTPTTGTQASRQNVNVQGEQVVQLREEQLNVEKQPVQTGEAVLRKEVVTEQKTINVPVSREELVIERRPVQPHESDRPITENAEDQTIRIPLREERVEVEKTAVVVEEVAVGKRVVTENEQVQETVRREEVHVDQGTAQGAKRYEDFDNDFRTNFQNTYAGRGGRYESYQPAYRFGYQLGTNPQYSSGDWSRYESNIRSSWERDNRDTAWDDVKDAVRFAWNRARGHGNR